MRAMIRFALASWSDSDPRCTILTVGVLLLLALMVKTPFPQAGIRNSLPPTAHHNPDCYYYCNLSRLGCQDISPERAHFSAGSLPDADGVRPLLPFRFAGPSIRDRGPAVRVSDIACRLFVFCRHFNSGSTDSTASAAKINRVNPHFQRRQRLLDSQRWDSNPQPLVYKTRALPLSYVGIMRAKAISAPGT